MKHERYSTTEGRVLYRAETNRHHTLWKKDWYTGTFEKQQLREMAGLVLQLSIVSHRDLHANVAPPSKPNRNLMQGIYNYNRRLEIPDPYERFEAITEMLGHISLTSGNTRNREDAHALHSNFTDQLVYIREGKLEPYYGE